MQHEGKAYIVSESSNLSKTSLGQKSEITQQLKLPVTLPQTLFSTNQRQNNFSTPVHNNEENRPECFNSLYGPFSVILCILGSSCVTLMPAHNVITNPEFWYEVILHSILLIFVQASLTIIRAQMVFSCFNKNMLKKTLDLGCTHLFTTAILFCMIHLIWTTFLGYFEPFPFKCFLAFYTSFFIMLIRLWHLFPKVKRTDPIFLKRQNAFIYYLLWSSLVTFQLHGIGKMFDLVPLNFQWMLAIIVPLIKHMNDYVIGKLISKAATFDNIVDTKLLGKITTGLMFSFWIAVFLATSATQVTGYVLLSINFVMNLILCIQAIKWHKKLSSNGVMTTINHSLKNEALTELILNEVVEFMVPVAFIGSFAIAFYGPNHGILGNVGCDYWSFQKVENLNVLFTPLLVMTTIDCGSVIISGTLLWKHCRINVFLEYCETIKKYWVVLALFGAWNLNKVDI